MNVTRRDIIIIIVSGVIMCLLGLAISHDPREQPDGSVSEVAP